jgi:hypothetical protein
LVVLSFFNDGSSWKSKRIIILEKFKVNFLEN